jgi:iron(III) transport system permease protein
MIPWPSTYSFAAVWEFRQALGWTLVIAASAATASMLIAVPLAWWGRRGGWRSVPGLLLASAGAATMGPLVGVTIIQWMGASHLPWMIWAYDRTVLAPVLAATWRCLPLTVLLCWFAFAGLSEHLVDAARVDGAGALRRLMSVGVRSRQAALAAAWFVALALASGELSASILVVPPGVTTVSIRVFGLLHAGVGNQAAALCLTNLAVLSCLALAVSGCVGRMVREEGRGAGIDWRISTRVT